MNVQTPMRDMLVVEKEIRRDKTEGGILLPGQIMEAATAQGKVLQVGEGVVNDKTGELVNVDVQVGDIVLFHNTSGIRLTEKGVQPEQYLLREEDVLAIVID